MNAFDLLKFFMYCIFVGYVGLLCMAALTDCISYKIPNYIIVGLCALFALGAATVSMGFVLWVWHGAGLLGAFSVALVVWRSGFMGGGDVKLISAVGLWTGLDGVPSLLFAIALVGGALTAILVVGRWAARQVIMRMDEIPAILGRGQPIPYGVAIAVGGLLVIPDIPVLAPVLDGLLEGLSG